jgi:Novel STAND NTPase 3
VSDPTPATEVIGQASTEAAGDDTGSPTGGTPGLVFNLNALGWKAFQDLCGTILGANLGQTLSVFRPTRDAGRDFAFEGEWIRANGESLRGHFVVQCKFKSNGTFYPSDLDEDLPKIASLGASGRCESYILMTNGAMTATTDAELTDRVKACGVQHLFLAGGDRIDLWLREDPRLRALVPRVYGLGDLTQILDERRYRQAAALLATMREDISKFVVTAPYERALTALGDHGFVLLLGAPAAGKSMIAAALAAGSIDQWSCRPMKIEAPDAFVAAWNPDEGRQLLWVDDAFGATQYQHERSDEWNHVLPQVRAAVRHGTRVVMTSRDYIWQAARQDLKLSSFPPLETGQVVVDVHELTQDDKRSILYNHLRYGSQPRAFRTSVKPYLDEVSLIADFLPEVARRFGDPQFTRNVRPVAVSVVRFFERPVEHLQEVVGGLGRNEFAALTLIYMARGSRPSPVTPTSDELTAFGRLGVNVAGVIEGLESLRGSLTLLTGDPDRPGAVRWTFKHPTIADAVRLRVAQRYELIDIYLSGAPLDAMLGEVTCGDVGLAGALVVPEGLFTTVAERISAGPQDHFAQERVANFLVTRCNPAFLAHHAARLSRLELDPDSPGALRIASRLRDLGLLSEETRMKMVAYYRRMAVDWLDFRILTDGDVSWVARPEELAALKGELRDEVLVRLESYVDTQDDNYAGDEDPDDVVGRVRRTLESLSDLYPDDLEVADAVLRVEPSVDRLSERLREQWRGDADDDYDYWRDRSHPMATSPSIFDDVDD